MFRVVSAVVLPSVHAMTFARVRSWWPLLLVLGGTILLVTSGCFGWGGHSRQTQRSSSVVAFLYPNQSNPLPPVDIPVLRLPLRVGIAFVPSDRNDISEMQRSVLLQRVAAEFKGRDYIESIEIVPGTYLRKEGGFENLNQVRRLLNFDVVALVAYDQVQFTDQNFL